MSALHFRTVDSPVGPLTLAGKGRCLMHLWMVDQTYEPSHSGWERDEDAFSDAVEQLESYFAGERREFDLELDLVGTTFQRRVWEALLTIPYGETRSYGQIAEQNRFAGCFPCGRPSQRPQSNRDYRAVSSGHRCEWQPHWVRRWAGAEKDPARA